MLLIDAIKGSDIRINTSSASAAVAAIRLFNKNIVPLDYRDEPVCGKSSKDFCEDIGEESVLSHLRNLSVELFQQDMICLRLCRPLLRFLNSEVPRRSRKRSRNEGGRTILKM